MSKFINGEKIANSNSVNIVPHALSVEDTIDNYAINTKKEYWWKKLFK